MLVTEDWFLLSHFQPLVRALGELAGEVVVATRSSGRFAEIEALGARAVAFDYRRSSLNPWDQASAAWRLARLLRRERPDAVHAIALKPIVLSCAAFPFSKVSRLALHLTGVGFAGTAASSRRSTLYGGVSRMIALALRRKSAWLFVENPDDVAQLARHGPVDWDRVTILGGAGIDPEAYPDTPLPPFEPARAGYVGRMIWSKGVDILVEAHRLLQADGVPMALRLCGTPDPDNPRAIDFDTLHRWNQEPGISWLGRIDDIASFWRETAIAVVPSRGGEGLPRALLEAAACGRPLIVTDVPGCRQFVRDGHDGLLVPANDPQALAKAMVRLVRNPELAARLGKAARARVLDGFTERHVATGIREAYGRMPPAHEDGDA